MILCLGDCVGYKLLLCLFALCFGGARSQACNDGDIRLAGGPNEFEGRVEYCLGSTWGHACGSNWEGEEARVACRQLGSESLNYLLLTTTVSYYDAQSGPAFITNLDCADGNELTLTNCSKLEINTTGCSTMGGFVYLICQDPECEGSEPTVRLVGESSDSTGRVEVCDSDGRRRQVCEAGWDDQDATVVCRTLGFQDGQGAVALSGYELSSVRLSIYNNVGCSGNEQFFSDCSFVPLNVFAVPSRCDGFAGVRCSDPQPTPTSTSVPIPSAVSTLEVTSIASTTVPALDTSSPLSSVPQSVQSSSSTPTTALTQTVLPSAQSSIPTTALTQTELLSLQSSSISTQTELLSVQLSSSTTATFTQSELPTVQSSSISTTAFTQTGLPSIQSSSTSTTAFTQTELPTIQSPTIASTQTEILSAQSPSTSTTASTQPSSQTQSSVMPVTTGLPTPPPNADNSLLITVVGSVGGAVVLLLLLIVILFLLILLKRNRRTDKYTIPTANTTLRHTHNLTNGMHMHNGMHNGNGELPPIPMTELEASVKEEEFDSPVPPRPSRHSSAYEHVLLNPLYTDGRSRSNTIISDQSSVFEDPAYAEVRGMARKRSPREKVSEDGSSVDSTASQRSHSPMVRHGSDLSTSRQQLLGSNRSLSNRELPSRPALDAEGYAALDNAGGAHLYDDMNHMYDDANHLSTSMMSTSMRNNLVPVNELLLAASPYEKPAAFPAFNGPSDVLKGSLLSPQHKFGARSNPNLSATNPQRGFLIPPVQPNLRFGTSNPNLNIPASHEYRDLEEITTRRSWYDSPRIARAYEDPMSAVDGVGARAYEDPSALGITHAQDYESPKITLSADDKHDYDYPKGAMELQTIPEYATLDS